MKTQRVEQGALQDMAARTNWAGNYTYEAVEVRQPADVEEVQRIVVASEHCKAVGATHSFNSVADTTGTQISLERLDTMTLDEEARTVTVGAGVRYGRLAPWLDERGFALANLASLPHLSVAGACATATHGSGARNRSLAAAVAAVEFVSGQGEVVHVSRKENTDIFLGMVVSLGMLGVVTSLTLDAEPRFDVAQTVYEGLSFDRLEDGFDVVMSSAYSVSLFTDWQQHRATQVWLKRRVEVVERLGESFHGAALQTTKLHPLPGHSAENCSEQFGVAGPWYQRLPHFRMEFTPSSGAEMQSEYFVAKAHAWAALQAIEELRDRITPYLFVSEIRMIAADDLWLSMAYQRDSVAFHFTWKPDWPAVQQILPLMEEKLARFQARPHWAKLFKTSAVELHALYPRFDDFQALRREYDPLGRFHNSFAREHLL